MAQVALAWLVDRPTVTSVILGARTLEQLQDNLGAAGLHLSEEETARLDAASDPARRTTPTAGRAPTSAAGWSRAPPPNEQPRRQRRPARGHGPKRSRG